MKIEDIKQIAVIGAGNMGHQIATLCAMKGFRTFCTDTDKPTLDKARVFFDDYIASRVDKQKLTAEEAEKVKASLSFTQDLKEAVQSADFVIEAIIEVLDIKRVLFSNIDKISTQAYNPGNKQFLYRELQDCRCNKEA